MYFQTPETFSLSDVNGPITHNSLVVDSQLSQATVSGEGSATYDLTTSQFFQEILVDPTTETLPPVENPPLVSEQTTTTSAILEDEEEDESQGKENNEQNIAIDERPLRKNNKALSVSSLIFFLKALQQMAQAAKWLLLPLE